MNVLNELVLHIKKRFFVAVNSKIYIEWKLFTFVIFRDYIYRVYICNFQVKLTNIGLDFVCPSLLGVTVCADFFNSVVILLMLSDGTSVSSSSSI